MSEKSIFITKPWLKSNLISGANLFLSQECSGFNFTLLAFPNCSGKTGKTDNEEEGANMKFNFLPKVTIPKRIKAETLQTKKGREKIRYDNCGGDGLL